MNNKSKKLINRLYFVSDTIHDKKIIKKYALSILQPIIINHFQNIYLRHKKI